MKAETPCYPSAAAKELRPFASSLARTPSPADALVSDQDPESDGQESPHPRPLVTSAGANQELPASPKLTPSRFSSSTKKTSVNLNNEPHVISLINCS